MTALANSFSACHRTPRTNSSVRSQTPRRIRWDVVAAGRISWSRAESWCAMMPDGRRVGLDRGRRCDGRRDRGGWHMRGCRSSKGGGEVAKYRRRRRCVSFPPTLGHLAARRCRGAVISRAFYDALDVGRPSTKECLLRSEGIYFSLHSGDSLSLCILPPLSPFIGDTFRCYCDRGGSSSMMGVAVFCERVECRSCSGRSPR